MNDDWVQNVAKYLQREYPSLPLSQIESIVRENRTDTGRRKKLLDSALEAQRYFNQTKRGSSTGAGADPNTSATNDAVVADWLARFPLLTPEQVRTTIERIPPGTTRIAEFQRLQTSAEKRRFAQATDMLQREEQQQNSNNTSAAANAPNRSPTRDQQQEKHNAGEIARAAAAVNEKDPNGGASLWSDASVLQRRRLLAHYIVQFPLLNEKGVQAILESTFDLPAAEAIMERHQRNFGNVKTPSCAAAAAAATTTTSLDKLAVYNTERGKNKKKRTSAATLVVDQVGNAMRQASPAVAATSSHFGTIPAPSPVFEINDRILSNSATNVEEAELRFYCDMFPSLPIAAVVRGIKNHTETDARIQFLMAEHEAEEQRQQEARRMERERVEEEQRERDAIALAEADRPSGGNRGGNKQARKQQAKAAVGNENAVVVVNNNNNDDDDDENDVATTTAAARNLAEIATAAKQLARHKAAVDQYLVEFPTLSREDITRVMENSTDTVAALRRVCAAREEALFKQLDEEVDRERQQQQQPKHEDPVASAATNAVVDAPADPDKACTVCFEKNRTHAFIPCGHRVVCAECAVAVQKANATRVRVCVCCQTPYVGIFRIFD